MQSIENRIKCELIHSALSVALETLRKAGEKDSGPHSPMGLLRRALDKRAEELRASYQARLTSPPIR